MGDLSVILPSYFGLCGERAVKERGYYLIESANAKIHKSNSSAREINARFNLLKQLGLAGFPHTDFILPAADGAPYVCLGRDVFVMTRRLKGREPDMGCVKDFSVVLESLAKFHMAARGLEVQGIESARPLSEIFIKQKNLLASIVKSIKRSPRLSDFDVLLLKHADSYTERVETAAEILNASDYEKLFSNASEKKHFCHNALKEETFSIIDDVCCISNFEEVTVDLQLSDIASVLRRFARKSNRAFPVARLLEIYDKILPLPASAEKILYAQLYFPWPFLKIISQYYSKKRNFIPIAITSRMTGILEEQDAYDGYINGLV